MFYQLHHMVSPEYLKKEYGENFSYPPHMHQCFELVLILEGHMTITVKDSVYELDAGEAVFIFPNCLHSFSSSKSKHMLFIFSQKLVQSFTVKYSGMIPLSSKFKLDPYIISALNALEPEDSIISVKGLLYSAVAAFEKQVEFGRSYNDKDNLLMQLFEFVDANYRTECTLIEAAHAVGYDH